MKELTISLDPQSVTPLYEQIYQYVKEDIQSGRLGVWWSKATIFTVTCDIWRLEKYCRTCI